MKWEMDYWFYLFGAIILIFAAIERRVPYLWLLGGLLIAIGIILRQFLNGGGKDGRRDGRKDDKKRG